MSARRPALVVALVTTGLVSIPAQVILLRELTVAFYGVELVYLLGLGTWLAWAALGASVASRRWPPSPGGLAALFGLFAVALPLSVAFLRAARPLLSGLPGAYLPFERGLVALVLALLPAALLLGLLFQWAARLLVAAGGTLAEAYALESAGALAGGILVTVALASGLDATRLSLAASLAATAAAFALGGRRARAVVALAAAVAAALLVAGASIDQAMTRFAHPGLVESRDSPYARLTITRRAGQTVLFVNDALAFETEGTEAEAFVHPVLLQHPQPEAVAVLGGCVEGLVGEALRHRPRRLDCIELDAVLLDLARRHLPDTLTRPLSAPGVRVVEADPRRFLATPGPDYDVILIGMPDPESGQANRFYTREFFELCRRRLRPSGVLGLRMRAAESFWAPPIALRMASVARALAAVFPHMLVLPGTTSVVVASGVPLERDAAPLIARLGERAIKSRLVRAGYLEYLLSDGRPQELAARIAATPAPANTDGRPVCYAYAAIVWLARFFPRLAFTPPVWLMGEASFRAPLAALVFVVAGLLIARRSPTGRSTALVAIAGFVGMVAESVLILHYQSARGALFRDLGALLTSFMAGLALGAWAVPRLRAPWTGAALAGGLAGLGLAVALEVRWGFAASLPGIALLLFVVGLVVGGVFAQASLAAVTDRARLVSPLYAADLLGGAAGGLLVSLVLVPAFGLEGSAYGLAALGAASFLLLTSARP